jgi:hypothetical protein
LLANLLVLLPYAQQHGQTGSAWTACYNVFILQSGS